MKKQKIQFLLLMIILLLCIGGYMLIRNQDFETNETVENETVTVTEIDSKKVTALKVTGAHTYSLVKRGEEWIEESIPDEDIDEGTVDSLISMLCSMNTTNTVIETPADLTQYGLEEPVITAALLLEDGSETAIHFGDYSDLYLKYYAKVDGDDNVYLVANSNCSRLMKDPEDFVAAQETETAVETETQEEKETTEETEPTE